MTPRSLLIPLFAALLLTRAGVVHAGRITIYRDGETSEVRVKSGERDRFLKGPSLH